MNHCLKLWDSLHRGASCRGFLVYEEADSHTLVHGLVSRRSTSTRVLCQSQQLRTQTLDDAGQVHHHRRIHSPSCPTLVVVRLYKVCLCEGGYVCLAQSVFPFLSTGHKITPTYIPQGVTRSQDPFGEPRSRQVTMRHCSDLLQVGGEGAKSRSRCVARVGKGEGIGEGLPL